MKPFRDLTPLPGKSTIASEAVATDVELLCEEASEMSKSLEVHTLDLLWVKSEI